MLENCFRSYDYDSDELRVFPDEHNLLRLEIVKDGIVKNSIRLRQETIKDLIFLLNNIKESRNEYGKAR